MKFLIFVVIYLAKVEQKKQPIPKSSFCSCIVLRNEKIFVVHSSKMCFSYVRFLGCDGSGLFPGNIYLFKINNWNTGKMC